MMAVGSVFAMGSTIKVADRVAAIDVLLRLDQHLVVRKAAS
jgi:hypothetical protein